MTHLRNDYAETLMEKRILYVPSCLIVEMLTKLYSQVATINLSGDLHNVTPDLLILLRRMRHNLKLTSEAYEQNRIRYFIGDWRDDKLRARKLFFNIMASLGYISELLERVERNMLYAAIEGVTAEWSALDKLIDAKAEERKCCAGTVCGSFCNCNSAGWRQAMADSLLSIYNTTDYYGSVDCLILVCYNKSRNELLDAIEEGLRELGSTERVNRDRILSVSHENMPAACQKCGEGVCAADAGMPVSTNRVSSTTPLHPSTGTTVTLPRRYVMPPSLASLSPGNL